MYNLGFLPKRLSDFFRSIYSSWNIDWCPSPNFLFLVGAEKASFYEAKLRKTEYAFVSKLFNNGLAKVQEDWNNKNGRFYNQLSIKL